MQFFRSVTWLVIIGSLIGGLQSARADTWQLLREGLQLCQSDEQNRYRHRMIVMPATVGGTVPVAWRDLNAAFDSAFNRVMRTRTDFDVQFLQGLEVASLGISERAHALSVLGRQTSAQYLLLPRIDRPEVKAEYETEPDPVKRAFKRFSSSLEGKQPVEFGLTLELFDLRRGSKVASEQVVLSTEVPKRAGTRRITLNQDTIDRVGEFAEIVSAQLACEPVILPVLSANGRDVQLAAGSDLGLEPGDILDLALVQYSRFGNSSSYRTNPIDAKVTITQVMPERSFAQLSARAEVINLQPGDVALAR